MPAIICPSVEPSIETNSEQHLIWMVLHIARQTAGVINGDVFSVAPDSGLETCGFCGPAFSLPGARLIGPSVGRFPAAGEFKCPDTGLSAALSHLCLSCLTALCGGSCANGVSSSGSSDELDLSLDFVRFRVFRFWVFSLAAFAAFVSPATAAATGFRPAAAAAVPHFGSSCTPLPPRRLVTVRSGLATVLADAGVESLWAGDRLG